MILSAEEWCVSCKQAITAFIKGRSTRFHLFQEDRGKGLRLYLVIHRYYYYYYYYYYYLDTV